MTNTEVRKEFTLTGHKDCVYTITAGPEPNLVFSGGGDGMVVMWDLKNPEEGQLIARLPHSVYALHFLPDQNLLVAGHNYDGIHLLDWSSRKEIRSLQLTSAAIFDIQSVGNDLFVASGDGLVTVVDVLEWKVKYRVAHSSKSARTIAIGPAGDIAVGYSDHCIRILGQGDLAVKHQWLAHQNSVFSVRYSPDLKTLISSSRDAHLKVWDPDAGYGLVEDIPAHLYAINHIEFSPDAKHFVTCSLDKSIKVWRVEDFRLLKVIDKSRHAGHGTSVNKLLWTTFDNKLLSASDDRTISVWDIIFSQD